MMTDLVIPIDKMEEGIYKGFEWKIRYSGFDIKGLCSFDPYAGNYLLDLDEWERSKRLKAKIRYLINKELKGGLKNE